MSTRFCEYALADSHLAQDTPPIEVAGRKWVQVRGPPGSRRGSRTRRSDRRPRSRFRRRPHHAGNCHSKHSFPSHPIVERPGLSISGQGRTRKMLYPTFCRCNHRPLTAERQAIRSAIGWEGKHPHPPAYSPSFTYSLCDFRGGPGGMYSCPLALRFVFNRYPSPIQLSDTRHRATSTEVSSNRYSTYTAPDAN
jgi:hypothetical protein